MPDIGTDAADRGGVQGGTLTLINLDNPASSGGIISSVEVWFVAAGGEVTSFRVGSFYLVAGTDYKCRDSAAVGAVTKGSRQVISPLTIAVEIGDFIGCYWGEEAAQLEEEYTGGNGMMWVSGEFIDPNDQTTYSLAANVILSLGGTIIAADWTGKVSGVTNPAKVMGIAVGNIAKVKGVA